MGTSPTKAAALITSLPHAAVALLVTGTFGLALATRGQDTGQTSAGVDETNQAAVELQISFVLLLRI